MADDQSQRRGLKIGISIALLLVAAIVVAWSLWPDTPPGTPDQMYFWDLGNQELYADSKKLVPPTDAPSGFRTRDGEPGAVRAHVLACGSCASEGERFVGHLEKYTPQAREVLLQVAQDQEVPQSQVLLAQQQGRLVADPQASRWVPAQSPDGQAVISAGLRQCEGRGAVVTCIPGA